MAAKNRDDSRNQTSLMALLKTERAQFRRDGVYLILVQCEYKPIMLTRAVTACIHGVQFIGLSLTQVQCDFKGQNAQQSRQVTQVWPKPESWMLFTLVPNSS